MNFKFDQDQEMMRDSAKRLLTDLSPLSAVHKILDSDTLTYDEKLWQQMAESGWQGTAIPEEFGGAGLGYLELAVLAEEMGRALACVPFASSIYLAAEALLAAGSDQQKRTHLPKIASGETIATYAYAEKGRIDAEGAQVKASGGKLSGVKSPVADGLSAHLAIVSARDEQGAVSLYLVDLNGPGVQREPINSMDRTRKQARLRFDDAPAELLGQAGSGARIQEQVFDRAAALFAFEQVGGAQAALDMGTAYAKERYAFGRPIGSFQAIKHRLADMFVKIELARSNAYYAAWALSSAQDKLPLAAAYARVLAVDAYAFAAQENVQVHGGIGFTWEANPHLYMKRCKHLEGLLGGNLVWRGKLMRHIEQAA
jgi:alkylation response protein AidB-like acyl-CoA dehydrogenase